MIAKPIPGHFLLQSVFCTEPFAKRYRREKERGIPHNRFYHFILYFLGSSGSID